MDEPWAIRKAHLCFQLRWDKTIGTQGKVLSQGACVIMWDIKYLAVIGKVKVSDEFTERETGTKQSSILEA